MKISRISQFSGKKHEFDLPITTSEWEMWIGLNPPLIQNCFPNLTADQREFILTGVTKEEWDEVFQEEEPPC